MEFEEVKYGMLMKVLCDREGRIYDVWISFGSMLQLLKEHFELAPLEKSYRGEVAERYRYVDDGVEVGFISSITPVSYTHLTLPTTSRV